MGSYVPIGCALHGPLDAGYIEAAGEQQESWELKLMGCAGKAAGTWKLMRPDKLGQTRPCGHISMRCAWLPALTA